MSLFFPRQYRETLSPELEDLGTSLRLLRDKSLTDWEEGFVSDLQATLAKYKGETTLSPKQWEWVSRLEEKYGLDRIED